MASPKKKKYTSAEFASRGGKAAAAKLTPEQRHDRAVKAVAVRWERWRVAQAAQAAKALASET